MMIIGSRLRRLLPEAPTNPHQKSQEPEMLWPMGLWGSSLRDSELRRLGILLEAGAATAKLRGNRQAWIWSYRDDILGSFRKIGYMLSLSHQSPLVILPC